MFILKGFSSPVRFLGNQGQLFCLRNHEFLRIPWSSVRFWNITNRCWGSPYLCCTKQLIYSIEIHQFTMGYKIYKRYTIYIRCLCQQEIRDNHAYKGLGGNSSRHNSVFLHHSLFLSLIFVSKIILVTFIFDICLHNTDAGAGFINSN